MYHSGLIMFFIDTLPEVKVGARYGFSRADFDISPEDKLLSLNSGYIDLAKTYLSVHNV